MQILQEDFDQTKLSTDLAYSHMAMLTQLPNGSLASLMQVSGCTRRCSHTLPVRQGCSRSNSE